MMSLPHLQGCPAYEERRSGPHAASNSFATSRVASVYAAPGVTAPGVGTGRKGR
jgi:hypothetical protein